MLPCSLGLQGYYNTPMRKNILQSFPSIFTPLVSVKLLLMLIFVHVLFIVILGCKYFTRSYICGLVLVGGVYEGEVCDIAQAKFMQLCKPFS